MITDTNKGILTIAQNSKDCDYLRLAYVQAMSAKLTQTHSQYAVMVTYDMVVPDKYKVVFDHVIRMDIDWAKGESWKLANEWQAHDMAPFDQVLKVDADVLFFQDLASWWTIYDQYDFVPAVSAYTYRGSKVESDYYRKCFTSNELPNIYTGMMYFRRCDRVRDYFYLAFDLYHHWEKASLEYMDHTRPKLPSTDVVFALAAKLMEMDTQRDFSGFTHMKRYAQDVPTYLITESWYNNLQYYFDANMMLFIENIAQRRPFHYQNKGFITDELVLRYEKALGI